MPVKIRTNPQRTILKFCTNRLKEKRGTEYKKSLLQQSGYESKRYEIKNYFLNVCAKMI